MTKKRKYRPVSQAPLPAQGQRITARWRSSNQTWSFYRLDINEAAWLKERFKSMQASIKWGDAHPIPRIRDDGEALHGVRDAYMGLLGHAPDAQAAVDCLLEILGPLMAKHKRTFED